MSLGSGLTDGAAQWSSTPESRLLRPGVVLVGLLLVAANLRAAITAVGPVLRTIEEDQHLSSASLSILISVPLIAFAVFSPVAPKIAARLGLERAVGAALGLLAVGIGLRSIPPQALLWVGTALLGVGIALLNVLLPAVIKRDFPTRIGPITGAYIAVQYAVAALAAGVAVPLAGQAPGGWRVSLGIWAGVAVVALGVFGPQLRSSPGHPPRRARGNGSHARAPWTSALAWQVTLYMGLQSLAYFVLVAWLAPIEQDAGISPATAGFHQLLVNLFGILGSLSCSVLIHRLAHQGPIAALGAGLLITGFAGLLLLPELAVIWSSIAGFGTGINLVLVLSLFGLRTQHHNEAGALSGMAQSLGFGLAAIGLSAIGAMHDASHTWQPVLIGLIGLALVQAFVGFLASRARTISPIEFRARGLM